MKNELIIFDFFGVIVAEIAPVWFASRYEKEEAIRLKDFYFQKADLGEITMDNLLKQMSADLDVPYDQLVSEWKALYKVNWELVEYVRKLNKEFHVILLSNAPLGLVEEMMELNDLNDMFEKTFISCNVKVAKPDIRAYNNCLNAYENQFDRFYMIDDNEKNLVPVRELGGITIHFKENKDVFDFFDSLL